MSKLANFMLRSNPIVETKKEEISQVDHKPTLEVLPKMLEKIAQEMITTQKRTGGKVAKTLARGLTITLTDYKLSMTREGTMPSPTEERLVLDAFGLFCCARQARQSGKWRIISFMYFDIEKLPPREAEWARSFAKVVDEPLTDGMYTTIEPTGQVRIHKPHGMVAKQSQLFNVPVSGGYYE
jgi:hypothetical protein